MIRVTIKDKKTGLQKEVQISKTLSGDFLMRHHPDVDVIVMPEKFKLLVLPKDEQSDHVYNIQEKLFNYLVKRGVVIPDSVTSGNVYGSLQGSFPQQSPGGEDVTQVVVYNLANFIEEELPIADREKEFEDNMEKALLKPDTEGSTELGEVPQEPFKGSIPKYGFPTRGIYRYNY
jgi:hypothetical protein